MSVANAVAAVRSLREHPLLLRLLQILLLAITVGFCVWGVRHDWAKAGDRLEHARFGYLAVAFAVIAAYYLVFICGWIRMLAAWRIRVGYGEALEAEMISMLAKYVPGGVWTPAARTVALRRSAGVTETTTVLASILLEAALSAISGVIVFVIGLAWVRNAHAPLPLLIAFALLCAVLIHPRVFEPLANRLLRPFGSTITPLPFGIMLALLAFYCVTWLIGGLGLYFLLLSVDAHPALSTIAFLGGTSAIGAIVAVLAVFAPSGLGVREAAMYELLKAVTSNGPALDATLMNRLAITLVEVALFVVGLVGWRFRRQTADSPQT